MRRLLLVLVALAAIAAPLAAQSGVVKRNVWLRDGPSTSHTEVRKLLPGDEFVLLQAGLTDGYYKVQAATGEDGWLWHKNVRILNDGGSGGGGAAPAPAGPPETFNGCAPEGNAQSDRRKALNRLKNRNLPPAASDLDASLTLAAMLATGNDAQRWSTSRGGAVTGFVIEVKAGSKETVNCGASGVGSTDAHIELVANAETTAKRRRVIVEVTPRWRSFRSGQGEDWSTAALRTRLVGKCAAFTGWLFFDDEHDDEAANTAAAGATNVWRATAWEIHPVTAIQVVPCPN